MNSAHDRSSAAPSPRAKRRDATSARILETALKLLESEDLAALTMQRLASELGYTVGATYRYFESKDAIVATLQRGVLEGLGEDLRRALATFEQRAARPGKLTALTRVAIVARVYATLGTRRPTDARLLAMMSADPRNVLGSALGDANAQVAIRVGRDAVGELRSAREAGALSEGDDLERGLVLWAALQGIAQTKKLERWGIPGLEAEKLAESLVQALLAGWGADSARAREAIARAVEICARAPTRA